MRRGWRAIARSSTSWFTIRRATRRTWSSSALCIRRCGRNEELRLAASYSLDDAVAIHGAARTHVSAVRAVPREEPPLGKTGFAEEAMPWLDAVYRFALRLTSGNVA